jgi:hypothetical protein
MLLAMELEPTCLPLGLLCSTQIQRFCEEWFLWGPIFDTGRIAQVLLISILVKNAVFVVLANEATMAAQIDSPAPDEALY